jgi:hypothetical protein
VFIIVSIIKMMFTKVLICLLIILILMIIMFNNRLILLMLLFINLINVFIDTTVSWTLWIEISLAALTGILVFLSYTDFNTDLCFCIVIQILLYTTGLMSFLLSSSAMIFLFFFIFMNSIFIRYYNLRLKDLWYLLLLT